MTVRGCLRRTVSVPQSGLRSWLLRPIFGSRGVRAWARVVLFILLLVLAVVLFAVSIRALIFALPAQPRQLLHTLLHRPRTGGRLAPWLVGTNEVVLLACALVASTVMVWLDGRRLRDIGLVPRRRLREFAYGAAVGVAMITLLVGGLLASGAARVQLPTLSVGTAIAWGLAWALVALLVGLFEEIAFRGYVFATLREDYGFWPVTVVVAVLFTIAHGLNPGENPLGMVTAGLASVLFCLGIRRTGALWWAIGCHAAWDWSEDFLFGSADSGFHSMGRLFKLEPHGNMYLSGGTVGPEGSLLCFVVLFVAIMAVPRLIPRGAMVKSAS